MSGRKEATVETGVYAASAIAAAVVGLAAAIPLLREWGQMAAPVYVLAAVLAAWMSRRRTDERRDSSLNWLALVVLFGAALVPLGLEAAWRANTGPGFHAQSEAIVTEEAARALKGGIDPYTADYRHGPLEARPLGTKTHFPYLPGMLVFGLTRAFDGASALADARVAFAVVTVAVGTLALARPPLRRAPPTHRRVSALVLAVLPTGALLMATGGDDLPVLALMLLALVLAAEHRPGASGVVAGLAAITKQTAWILLPLLALAARDREGRPARLRYSTPAAAIVVLGLAPFVSWGPGDFVEDVIRFPLGLGQQRSAAETPTLGAALIRLFPSLRTPLTVTLICVVIAVFAFILVRRPPATAWAASRDAALVFLAALLVAPAARFGYVVYPIDLFVWSWALRASKGRTEVAIERRDTPAE